MKDSHDFIWLIDTEGAETSIFDKILGQSAVIWAALLLALLALGVLICSFAHLLIGGIWPICARSLIQAG